MKVVPRMFAVGAMIAIVVAATPAFAAGVGNSGTIKIATLGSSTSNENNEPHVDSCVFRADYYGFRAGTYDVTITGVAPTGGGQFRTDTVTIADSAHGNEYQTSRTYDLTAALAGVTPHPQQGYHIRYEAKNDGSPGNGAKTKVFWLECSPSGTGGSPEVRDRNTRRLNQQAEVLGTRFVRGGGSNAAVGGLATTGTPVQQVALGGFMLVALGLMLEATGRKRRHARR